MNKGKYIKAKKQTPVWYWALMLLFVSVFVACAWYLADYFWGSKEQADAYNDLAALVEANRPDMPDAPQHPDVPDMPDHPDDPDATASSEEVVAEENPELNLVNEDGILLEYAPLYEMNSDLAGWIQIEGTRINYPVMQTPDRVDYYLRRDFQGNSSTWGSIYVREECDLTEPSDNVTIYGHNMKDGSMFAGLHGYLKRTFWDEHRYIRFDTLREHHTYEIFAVFRTTASARKGFEYHEFIDADNAEEFDTFISRCLSLSLYDTNLVPEYGDKIICLSTCEYSQTNGRLVVAAVRID